MSGSVIQKLLELHQPEAVTTTPGSLFHAHNPLAKYLFLTLNLTLPDTAPCCSIQFCCCHWKSELSAVPLLSVRSCRLPQGLPSAPLFQAETTQGPQSHVLHSRTFITFVDLCQDTLGRKGEILSCWNAHLLRNKISYNHMGQVQLQETHCSLPASSSNTPQVLSQPEPNTVSTR